MTAYKLSDADFAEISGLLKSKGKLGSRLIRFHSQNKTVAASMIAEKKVSWHRSYRAVTRGQSLTQSNMISMRLRRLQRLLSYFTVLL